MEGVEKFQLFRVTLAESDQLDLLNRSETRREVLISSMMENPKVDTDENWRIGGVRWVDDDALAFQIGKIKIGKVGGWDDEGNMFVVDDGEEVLYTDAILDIKLQVLAIAREKELAANARTIAFKFCEMLHSSEAVRSSGYYPLVREMYDPESLLSRVGRASRVNTLWIGFGPSNSFDANEMFVKPLSKTVDALNATGGTVTYQGGRTEKGLNKESTKELIKAAAAEGKHATARLVDEGGEIVVARVDGKLAVVSVQRRASVGDFFTVAVDLVRQMYNKIRGEVSSVLKEKPKAGR